MKKELLHLAAKAALLIIIAVVPAWGQLPLKDDTAGRGKLKEVQPLTECEKKDLAEAQKELAEATGKLERVQQQIKANHGDSRYIYQTSRDFNIPSTVVDIQDSFALIWESMYVWLSGNSKYSSTSGTISIYKTK